MHAIGLYLRKIEHMIGAIAGDIIGSRFEFNNIKSKDFELFSEKSRFTDDTVLTLATADSLLNRKPYLETYKSWPLEYPNRGYGHHFNKWMHSKSPFPYNSWGNGSAMRISPVAWAFDDAEKVLEEAKKSARITHNHPEAIKGAQAVALAVFMARQQASKEDIAKEISKRFEYDLSRNLDDIRPEYQFNVSCQGSVPEAIIAFLESTDFEDAIRNAVSLGGDSDTIACICGGIAHAFYREIPSLIIKGITICLNEEMISVIDRFIEQYAVYY